MAGSGRGCYGWKSQTNSDYDPQRVMYQWRSTFPDHVDVKELLRRQNQPNRAEEEKRCDDAVSRYNIESCDKRRNNVRTNEASFHNS